MTATRVWAIEPAHTHIAFSVRHLGLTNSWGVFKRFDAQLSFDPSSIETSSVTFEVETDSIDTGMELRDKHLKGVDWFDVQTHPKAIFKSRSVTLTNWDRYTVVGDLTIRGVTHPVEFTALLTGHATNPWTQAKLTGFELTGAISRSAYGLGAFPGALSDTVHLRIETELACSIDAPQ